MSLLMDPSFLQHLEQPRPAKGIKYGIIIIILQLSIIPSPLRSLFLPNTDAHVYTHHIDFLLKPQMDKHMEACVRAKAQKSLTTCTHTHAAKFPIRHTSTLRQSPYSSVGAR